jgi:UDP-N-acetylmuramate dehydrogenase
MAPSWAGELKRLLPEARLDEPLARYTTFRIGGPADALVEARSRAELKTVLGFCRERGVPLMALGFGSNLLILDKGVRGVVLRLRGEFEAVEFLADHRVRAGAGVRVPQLVAACAERGLTGPEPIVGVPGTVGGALVMNAGTREGEIGPLVESVECFDRETLELKTLPRSGLRFDYRRSNLGNVVVARATLSLKPGDKAVIMTRVQQLQQRRLQTQPIHTFNVGSTFKNPPGRFVAQMVEEAGLKGLAIGGARVSPKHANFFENYRDAKAADVLALVEKVRGTIREKFGIDLELEMKVVGQA